MIKAEQTKLKYGYAPEDLSPASIRWICWQCDNCGHEREYRYSYWWRYKAGESKELCQKCSHSHRQGRVVIDVDKGSAQPLPPEVMIEETKKTLGYDPRDLSPWSRKEVIVKCSVLGTLHYTRRCSLNRNKAVIETGHFISTGGYTKSRRLGTTVSEETKQLMSHGQKIRRKIELEEKELINQQNKEHI